MKYTLTTCLILFAGLLVLTACDREEPAAESTEEAEFETFQGIEEEGGEEEPKGEAAETNVDPEEVLTQFGEFFGRQMSFFNRPRSFMCECGYAHGGTDMDPQRCLRAITLSDEEREKFGTCMAESGPELTQELANELDGHLDCVNEVFTNAMECVEAIDEKYGELCSSDDLDAVKEDFAECSRTYSSSSMECQRRLSRELGDWFKEAWREARRPPEVCLRGSLTAFPAPGDIVLD